MADVMRAATQQAEDVPPFELSSFLEGLADLHGADLEAAMVPFGRASADQRGGVPGGRDAGDRAPGAVDVSALSDRREGRRRGGAREGRGP